MTRENSRAGTPPPQPWSASRPKPTRGGGNSSPGGAVWDEDAAHSAAECRHKTECVSAARDGGAAGRGSGGTAGAGAPLEYPISGNRDKDPRRRAGYAGPGRGGRVFGTAGARGGAGGCAGGAGGTGGASGGDQTSAADQAPADEPEAAGVGRGARGRGAGGGGTAGGGRRRMVGLGWAVGRRSRLRWKNTDIASCNVVRWRRVGRLEWENTTKTLPMERLPGAGLGPRAAGIAAATEAGGAPQMGKHDKDPMPIERLPGAGPGAPAAGIAAATEAGGARTAGADAILAALPNRVARRRWKSLQRRAHPARRANPAE